ncbi:MAG TPA: LCP family protein [Acidimicrobiia bacterium]|nr:LCP family protein [Acidimicrobiia bacterium]
MSAPGTPPSASRPWLAAFASAIVPGVGQFIAGDRRRGRNLLIINVVILVAIAFFFRDRVAVLTAWLQPTSLALMMVGNIILLGYRIWAADDAYRSAKGRAPATIRSPTAAVLGGAVGLSMVLLVPHVVFGYYDLVQYDLLTSVFTASSTTTTVVAGEDPTTPSTDATGSTVTTQPGDTTTSTAPSGSAIWDGLDRLNILLIGGDYGTGRTGIRTDTMITVSIDPETGDAAMFSVPRNWTQAPLPDGMGVWDCNCYPELINELWVAGEQHPEAFPGPGTPSENAVKGVISEFLGIPIHYYAMVNLDGFVDIVDALGGVEIYIPSTVIDEEYPNEDGTTTERIQIDQGWQELDGHLALAYSRTRNQDSDYFRMNRQRCVIEAIIDKADPVSLLRNFGKLADVVKDTTLTDIPLDALPQLVQLLPDLDLESVVSVRFIPPEYHLKYRDDGQPGRVANIDLVHEHVDLVITDPQRAIEELGLEKLDDVCGPPA